MIAKSILTTKHTTNWSVVEEIVKIVSFSRPWSSDKNVSIDESGRYILYVILFEDNIVTRSFYVFYYDVASYAQRLA